MRTMNVSRPVHRRGAGAARGARASTMRAGVTTTRRRASKSCLLDTQALRTRKPFCHRHLARAALERRRPPRMRGNGLRTAARHPSGSVGSTRRRSNCETTRTLAGSFVRFALSATARKMPGAKSCRLRYPTVGPFTHCTANHVRLSVRSCDHRRTSNSQRSFASRPPQSISPRRTGPPHGDRNKRGVGRHASMNDAASSERATCRRCRPVSSSSRSAR